MIRNSREALKIGRALYFGEGKIPNEDSANYWFQQSEASNDPEIIYEIAGIYEYGGEIYKALWYYQKAANLGHIESHIDLANLYGYTGYEYMPVPYDFPRSFSEAAKWLSKVLLKKKQIAKNRFEILKNTLKMYQMLSLLENVNINSFYHITHINNVHSIQNKGLLSRNDLFKNNISYTNISNPDVQNLRNIEDPIFHNSIHDYIPLYVNPKNPMLYAKKNVQDQLVILEIDFIIITHQFIYTDGNAASKNTKFYSSLDQLNQLPIDTLHATYWTDKPGGKRKRCTEFLIHSNISPIYVRAIHCINQESGEKLKLGTFSPPILINPDLFFE